jgi:hypothetical protein
MEGFELIPIEDLDGFIPMPGNRGLIDFVHPVLVIDEAEGMHIATAYKWMKIPPGGLPAVLGEMFFISIKNKPLRHVIYFCKGIQN